MDLMRLLLRRGADVNGSKLCLLTPLKQACASPTYLWIAHLLLDWGADVNLGNPLAHVVWRADYNGVELLLRHGANAYSLRGRNLSGDCPKEQRLRLLDLLKDHAANYNPVLVSDRGHGLFRRLRVRPMLKWWRLDPES